MGREAWLAREGAGLSRGRGMLDPHREVGELAGRPRERTAALNNERQCRVELVPFGGRRRCPIPPLPAMLAQNRRQRPARFCEAAPAKVDIVKVQQLCTRNGGEQRGG